MRVVVGGLGKSGTTALYHAVRGGMPPGTVCLFEPRKVLPPPTGPVLAKLLAEFDWAPYRTFDRRVWIVRDPRDRLVSFLLYSIFNHRGPISAADRGRLLNLLRCKEADGRAVGLRRLQQELERITGTDLSARLRERQAVALRVLAENPDFHRVRYEDFVAGETRKLESYLGFPLAADVRVDAGLRRVERTRGSGDWKNWFAPEDIAYYRPLLLELMRAYDYEDRWEPAAAPCVAPAHGSEYVARLLDERRPVPQGMRGMIRNLLNRFGLRASTGRGAA